MNIKHLLEKVAKAENHYYDLPRHVSCVVTGDGVTDIIGERKYTTKDGTLIVEVIDCNVARVTACPFLAGDKLWNGPNGIPDKHYRSMLASLFHDLIWGHSEELAEAWACSNREVMDWGTDVLYAVWFAASKDSTWGRIEARLAWHACRLSAPIWSHVKRWLGIVCLAIAFCGCSAPPDWAVDDYVGTNVIHDILIDAPVPLPVPPSGKPSVNDADQVPFDSLHWDYGGFRGGGASLTEARIDDLAISGNRMSYRWTKGSCEEQLGASDRGDASCLACLFVLRDGMWSGGKFDWISTSRTSRSFENIRGNYHGWPSDSIERADAFAFVIVSRNGRRRTNVITDRR